MEQTLAKIYKTLTWSFSFLAWKYLVLWCEHHDTGKISNSFPAPKNHYNSVSHHPPNFHLTLPLNRVRPWFTGSNDHTMEIPCGDWKSLMENRWDRTLCLSSAFKCTAFPQSLWECPCRWNMETVVNEMLYFFYIHGFSQASTRWFPWIYASSEPLFFKVFQKYFPP